MDFLIRNMAKEDINRVGEIIYEAFNSVAIKYGYISNVNSVEEGSRLAWTLFHHGPCERLVAEVEGRVVGSACLSIRGDFAGLGPAVVDPYCQDKAMGKELISGVLKKAENLKSIRTFTESFNPAAFSLYYFSSNFMPVADVLDLFHNGIAQNLTDQSCNVSQTTMKDIEEIYIYDYPRSKLDRRPDIRFYINWGKVLAFRHQQKIRGFLVCLPGPRWVQLGPLVAEGEEEAECLFRYALMFYKGKNFRSRIMAKDYKLAKALKGVGFRIYCMNNLLVRGKWRPSKFIEAFGIFPEAV
jgi:hypothetical protein